MFSKIAHGFLGSKEGLVARGRRKGEEAFANDAVVIGLLQRFSGGINGVDVIGGRVENVTAPDVACTKEPADVGRGHFYVQARIEWVVARAAFHGDSSRSMASG